MCSRYSRSSKTGLILAVVGVFLLTRGVFFPAGILLAIAAIKLGRYWQNPSRRVLAVIRKDAARFGLRVPYDPVIVPNLEKIYAKYWNATENFHSLAPQYDEVLTSMWTELRGAGSIQEWRQIVRRVLEGWSAPWLDADRPVDQSLGRLRRASAQWRDARNEAFGPSPRPT